jgi:hypothetical protein
MGILATSIVAFAYLPTIPAGLAVWGGYKPHLIFIFLWCPFALFYLRKKFGPMLMLPALALLYGLSEIFFNSLAFLAYFVSPGSVTYFFLPGWDLFFLVIVGAVAACYLIVRPRFTMSPVLFLFIAWGLIWLATGLKSVDDAMLGAPQNIPWDIAWQLNMFAFGAWVMKKR